MKWKICCTLFNLDSHLFLVAHLLPLPLIQALLPHKIVDIAWISLAALKLCPSRVYWIDNEHKTINQSSAPSSSLLVTALIASFPLHLSLLTVTSSRAGTLYNSERNPTEAEKHNLNQGKTTIFTCNKLGQTCKFHKSFSFYVIIGYLSKIIGICCLSIQIYLTSFLWGTPSYGRT